MNNYKSRYPCRLWLPGLFFFWVIWLCSAPSFGAGPNAGQNAGPNNCQDTGPQLVVSYYATAEVIASLKVKCGDRFTIRYIHSVDKTPIFEEFRLDRKKGLVLEKTWFTMFGAGLGHWPGHGNLSQDSKWITIDNIEQPLGSFILRIGAPSVGHTIIYHEQEINLSRLAPGARTLVEFKK